ncbi:MAG: cytochrome c biogenesis protein CcdA [Gammaproteobacteria bacterium]
MHFFRTSKKIRQTKQTSRTFFCLAFWALMHCAFAWSDPPFEPDLEIPAFQLLIQEKKESLALQWQIQEGIVFYPQKIQFLDPQGQKLNLNFGQEILPKKAETQFNLEIQKSKLQAIYPNWKQIQIKYQGCEKTGLCLAPVIQALYPNSETVQVNQANQTNLSSPSQKNLDKNLDVQTILAERNFFIIIITFMGLGILLAFTPCVLPMIPIVANIITSQDKGLSKAHTLRLVLVYVLSMAFCYALMGYITAKLGFSLQLSIQKPEIIIPAAILVIICALQQFDLIQFSFRFNFLSQKTKKINSKIRSKIAKINFPKPNNATLNAAGQGAFSAFIASPCVTPVLVGALAYISQTGHIWLGSASLFFMAIGLGLPLLAFAALGTKLLPKTGAWMIKVKYFIGFLLLLLSVWLLSHLNLKALGSKLGIATESEDQMPNSKYPWKSLNSMAELNRLETEAAAKNQAIVMKVSANWCANCLVLEKNLEKPNPILEPIFSKALLLKLDLSENNNATKKELVKSLGIFGPPSMLCYKPRSKTWEKSLGQTDLKAIQDFLERCAQN